MTAEQPKIKIHEQALASLTWKELANCFDI